MLYSDRVHHRPALRPSGSIGLPSSHPSPPGLERFMIDTPTQPARRPRVPTTVDRYWLVPVLPSLDIEESALLDGETRIGADASCDIFLPVPGVEPQHCTLRVS